MRREALRAGALSVAAVLGVASAAGGVLTLRGVLDAGAGATLALGVAVGLLVSAGHVLLALRTAAHVEAACARALRPDAPAPHAPGRQVGGVVRALEALRWRVDVAEGLAEQRRVEALTASAGVRELVAGLVTAEEGARGQLAAELHDTVAQSLALARQLLADGLPTADDLARLSDHVEDAEEQLRAVLARTRPPALRDSDLGAAVSDLRADLRARYGLEIDVTWPSPPVPLPLASAVTVYRFFQEALLNVVKHADVDRAHLCLEVLPDELVASVGDSGAGFEPELVRPDAGRHVGLVLLAERARLCGGGLEVLSGGGHVGALVRLRLPRPPVTPVRIPSQRAPAPGRAGRLVRSS